MSEGRRFAGRLSEEYRLVEKALPHFHLLQEAVGHAVADYRPAAPADTVVVLELGCGDGVTSDVLLRSRTDLQLVALDNEPTMVEQARLNLKDRPSVQVVEADALSYLRATCEDSIDIVASALTIHNLGRAYRDAVLIACRRALKPGGLFVNADKYAPDGQARFDALVTQLGRFFDTFIPMEKYDLLKDWVLHNVADQAPDRAMPETEAVGRMLDIGFVQVRVADRHNMEAVMTALKPR